MVRVKNLLHFITYAAVSIGYISVCRYVNLVSSAIFFALSLLAIYVHLTQRISIKRWILNSTSVLVILFSASRINPNFLVEPILDGFLVLIATKLVEADKVRDYLQIYTLCLFLLLGSALLSVSFAFVLYLLLLAFLVTLSLILLAYGSVEREITLSFPAIRRVIEQALMICGLSIPATVLFFLILPRTDYPILMLFGPGYTARSGFSDRVSLGEVNCIQEDSSVIFRAEMKRVDDSVLYWRGIILDAFDGKSWTTHYSQDIIDSYSLKGPMVHQIIYLEPYGNRYLFGLDKPVNIHLPTIQKHQDLSYSLPGEICRRLSYKVDSVITDKVSVKEHDLSPYLQLPDNISSSVKELAEQLSKGKNKEQSVQAFMNFFQKKGFRYSLENIPLSKTPLTDFLFKYRRGNCEYFASSLAVLLRLRGIPSRLVGGYKGGYYSRMGGYYLVLQKHAHVWVEAYIKGKGWIRLDPTPPLAIRASDLYRERLLTRLQLLLDILNYYWLRVIVNYDLSTQLYLLRKLESFTSISHHQVASRLKQVLKPLALGFLGLVIIFFVFMLIIRDLNRDPVSSLMRQFRVKMKDLGYEMGPCEGLEEFTRRIEYRELRCKVFDFVEELEQIIYKDRPLSKKKLQSLKKRLREI